MSFDFFANEQNATLLDASRHPSTNPEPSTWTGFGTGAAQYTMRGLAETGRAIDLLGAAFPVAIDAVTGGTERQDQYFREHDEIFNRAVEYWTPGPGEVGTAGQITGQLASGVLQAVINPAVLVGTAQLSTAEDLSRQGVDAATANTVGGIVGAGTAVGLKMPFLGKSLVSRVGTGAAGNVIQGVATAGAANAVLSASGDTQQAEQYDPWDVQARTLDVMLGAAFGGLAHIETKGAKLNLKPSDEAALLVANQARHAEEATSHGRPATEVDATLHAEAMRTALDQVLRGESVAVDGMVKDMQLVPDDAHARQRAEVADEAQRILEQEAMTAVPDVPEPPKPFTPMAEINPVEHSVAGLKARQFASDQPDMLMPTALVDAEGNPVHLRAADALNLADAEMAYAQNVAPNVFQTVAKCLLGAL